jgi:ferredoxin
LDEETGEPVQARFTFVDEHTCIGCTYCSTVARNTFFMQDDHGRARVYDQGGDSEDLVLEAIDSCPVNCIHFVSFEDLVILETERSGQRINNAARLVSQQEGTAAVPPSQARNYQSGVMRCNNCPSRGCKDCPMFGVGENPIFLARRAERLELREARGDTQREAERQQREVARG